MLLEALEILQSAGQDEDTFVTDFSIYKIIYILTVYIPLIISTFLFSQEYLGDKIACFAPENFTDAQAEATKEYCWNNGYWLSQGAIPRTKSLYTQPHRFYPLYLPIQAVIMMIPIIFWNIWTKTKLLAVLRGTEEFLEELQELLSKDEGNDPDALAEKSKERIKQFHSTCVSAARTSNLAKLGMCRVGLELFLTLFIFVLQFFIYNHKTKSYVCQIPELHPDNIMCTVPILDLLDLVWSINVSALIIALVMNFYLVFVLYKMHFSEFQPLFYNNLPYGDADDFNEKVIWDSRWTKDSYRLLTRIFQENNSIMTKAYILMAIKPHDEDNEEENKAFKKEDGKKVKKKPVPNAVSLQPYENGDVRSDGGGVSETKVVRRRIISTNREEPLRRTYVPSVASATGDYGIVSFLNRAAEISGSKPAGPRKLSIVS